MSIESQKFIEKIEKLEKKIAHRVQTPYKTMSKHTSLSYLPSIERGKSQMNTHYSTTSAGDQVDIDDLMK